MIILLAVEDSATSEAAVTRLIAQVKAQDTEVRLLHVLDPYPERLAKRRGPSIPDFTAARAKQLAVAAELLAQVSERLRSAGFPVSSSITVGDVRAVIVEEAKVWRADLLVLGSGQPRAKGIRRFFSGSISEDVARYAPCSVQIVRVWPAPAIISDVWPQENAQCFSEARSAGQIYRRN